MRDSKLVSRAPGTPRVTHVRATVCLVPLDTCKGHACEEDWASEQALEPEDVGPGERWPAWGGVGAIVRSGAARGGLRKVVVVVNLIINLT